jgi:hypothetical protein
MADKVGVRDVKITFDEDLPTVHPTHLVAQHDQHEFILNFFRLNLPLLVGTDEDKAARLEALERVHAQGLVRVIIPASRMAEFLSVLQQNYRTYQETAAEREAEAKK